MKKYIALALMLATVAFFGVKAYDKNYTRHTRAQRSTVLIESSKSYGSGFTIQRENPDGRSRTFVWTAAHVVRLDNEVKVSRVVRLNGRKVGSVNFTARVLLRDDALDIALLWLESPPEHFLPVVFARNDASVGDKVFHCGNFAGPLLEGSVSTGIISQVGISGPNFPWLFIDQTTAIVMHGSSGGALFDDWNSSVVGIVVGITGPGVTYFVPVSVVHSFAVLHDSEWAFSGNDCPADSGLLKLVQSAKVVQAPAPPDGVSDAFPDFWFN
jgi:S1-C subfamily serine protease